MRYFYESFSDKDVFVEAVFDHVIAGLATTTQAAVAAYPPTQAETQAVPPQPPIEPASVPPSQQRSGLEIYQRFRDGLADPECDSESTNGRWKKHFSHAPGQ